MRLAMRAHAADDEALMNRSWLRNSGRFRHLRWALAAVLVVLCAGTVGFMWVEHLDLLDALMATLSLMSTEGGTERPATPAGKILTIFVLIAGISALFYTLGALAEFLFEGHFRRAVGRYRMDRRIERLHEHAIICGFGRVGRRIATEFVAVGQPFVVVDIQEANTTRLQALGYAYVHGDATADATLLSAGIQHARMLLAATNDDTENIAITLSARALAPRLWIVARANQDETESKLLRAGADRVLSPYALGGHRMAGLARRPDLVGFLDTAMQGDAIDLALEEILVEPSSPLLGVGLPASQTELPAAFRECIVVAIRPHRTHQWILASQRGGQPIQVGDTLVVLGPVEQRRVASGAQGSDTNSTGKPPAH